MPYAKVSLNLGFPMVGARKGGDGTEEGPADRPGPGNPSPGWFASQSLVSLLLGNVENGGCPQGHLETASSVGLEQSRCFTKVPSLLVSPCISKSPQTPGLGQTLCRCPKLGDGEGRAKQARGPSLPCSSGQASLDPNQLGFPPQLSRALPQSAGLVSCSAEAPSAFGHCWESAFIHSLNR